MLSSRGVSRLRRLWMNTSMNDRCLPKHLLSYPGGPHPVEPIASQDTLPYYPHTAYHFHCSENAESLPAIAKRGA